jgi:ATP-binding cassette subfamily F protein 3
VALALITLQGSNLLALDEPTNHLDVESIEALEDALENFPGTILLVSHDRALLRELTTRVWAFERGRLLDYPGPFVDWEKKVAAEERDREEARLESERTARAEEKALSRKAAEAKREMGAPLRAARKTAALEEETVVEAEEAVAALRRALDHPDLYDGSPESAKEAGRLNLALKGAQETLDRALARWAEAVEKLESLEAEGSDHG